MQPLTTLRQGEESATLHPTAALLLHDGEPITEAGSRILSLDLSKAADPRGRGTIASHPLLPYPTFSPNGQRRLRGVMAGQVAGRIDAFGCATIRSELCHY